MSFQILENNNLIYVDGGMSTEISFAKYYAYRKNMTYSGWNINIRIVYPEIILETLKYIVETVKNIESMYCQKPVLLSPGFISVPYIIELCNMIYLPSQFLVGFNSFKDIELLLDNLKKNNIDAYAVCGYDGCIPNCLVAWIKFVKIPNIYMDLINKYLHSSNIILGGIFSKDNSTFGENFIYEYNNETYSIKSRNIYLLHINACYGKTPEVDWEIFSKLTNDFDTKKLKRKKIKYVHDWESSFDILSNSYISNTDKSYKGNIYTFSCLNTKKLYLISYELSKIFMNLNNIPLKGIVLNPYFINNPLYESNYGYLGYSYWIGNNKLYDEIKIVLEKDILPNNGEIWFNDQNNQLLPLYNSLNYDKKIICNNTSPLCNELSKWIFSNKPKEYKNFNFISILQFIKILQSLEIKC